MKKTLFTSILAVLMTALFGVGIYSSNSQSPSPDTLFLFPGQQLHFYAGVEADTVQYLEFQMLCYNYQLVWGEDQIHVMPFGEDFLIANGVYISQQQDPWMYRLAWTANNLDSWTGPFMVLSALHCEPQNVPIDDNYPVIIDLDCRICWGVGHVTWTNTVNDFRRLFVVNHNRLKGDVNNDGVVDVADISIAMSAFSGYYGLAFCNYFYSPGLNFSASNVATPWFDSINFFLINLWLRYPDDPLVASLGIGQPFEYGDQGYEIINPEVNGQSISIMPDGYHNIYAVQGRYADGRHWSQSVFIDRGELLRFSFGSINPFPETITRDRIEFTMPEGVSFVGAIARQLGSPTLVDDPTTPAVASISCYPNPFGGAGTTIKIKNSNARVEIYNIKGQKVKELVNKAKSQEIYWDGCNNRNQQCPAGLYFIRATEDNKKVTTIRVVKIH